MGTKWTAERRAKYKATVKAKKAKKATPAPPASRMIDALTYIKRAQQCLYDGGGDREGVEVYLMLAKRTIQGKD